LNGSLRTAIDVARNRRILSATSAIVEGRETQAILNFLREQKADLLIIGLHQHDFLCGASLEFCV
jgi:hypothetical protein